MTKNGERRASPALGKVIRAFLEYAFVFTVIIECNSLFHYSENYRQTSVEVVVTVFAILLAGILVLSCVYRHKQAFWKDLKKNWPVWSALLVFVFAFLVLNVLRRGAENSLRKYVLSFILFLPAACLLFRGYRMDGRPHELFYKHANLMLVFAVCNLVVFGALTLHPSVIQARLLESRWSSRGYLENFINYLNICCVDLEGTRTIAGFTFYRNMGFFTEPLMFCVPLITALFTEMFLRRKEDRRVWKWLVLMAAVAVSQSTLGMLLAAGAVGVKLIEGAAPKKRWLMVFPALVLVAAAVFVLLRQKAVIDTGSTATHIRHYVAAAKTFLEHPLIGCGYSREEPIILHLPPNTSWGLSNSVAVVLAEGGVLLGLLCMAPFFIGLAQIFSKNCKRVALWALGPFGLYCVTVFHFHLLLMLFIAFGYSMLEIREAESGGKRRLALAEDAEAPAAREDLTVPERVGRITGIILGCAAAAALFLSAGFWKALSRWMTLRQLYLGQSAWKAYFFFLFLILAVLTLRHALRALGKKSEGPWLAETLWLAIYSALFAAAYPAVFSLASTALDVPTPFGDFFETAALAGLYFGGVAVGWLLLALWRRSRKVFAAGAAAVAVLAAGAAGGTFLYVSRLSVPAGEIASALREAFAAAEGKIYANEHQTAMKRAMPELAYAPARDGAFTALDKATVVAAHDRNLRDLFAAGFQVTELSPDYVLYSDDAAVIETLRGEGYTFYKYYPFAMDVDNEAAVILKKGYRTLTAELRKEPEADPPHTSVGSLLITSYYGTKQVKKKTVYADDFDGEGCAKVNITFNAGEWEGMEYRFVPNDGFLLSSETLTLRETPTYILEKTYDGRYLTVKGAYFKPSGEPYYTTRGYSMTTKDYDRAGRLIQQTYYDGDGSPVIIDSGYAAFTRVYDSQGRLKKEAYFDENGRLCLQAEGYAAIERDYDRRGNAIALRYLGEDDRPIMTPAGYAELRRIYNSKRQVVELRYYDETGKSILLADGYWMEKRDYDAAGNVSAQQYYNTEGQSIVTAMGYAEIRREFNDKKKVVREEYFGADGNPIALPNGAASVRIEYDTNGKESARHYFDLNGEEFTQAS